MRREGEPESVVSQAGLADSLRNVGEVATAFVRRLDELRSGLPAGIPSGFRDLDHMTGGFGRSDFVVIAGRPSMGKTALMVNVAERATREGHGHHDPQAVLFVSLETHAEALVARMMASVAGLEPAELLNANATRTRLLNAALEELKRRPLMIDDRATTVDAIRKSALRCAETNGVGMLFVDALQTVRTQPRHSDREAELEEIAWSLKELAWELQCPVIASSYLGRGPERRCDRRPYLSDLRDSSAIEEVADLLLLLYRDDVYVEDSSEPNTIEVAMLKNRNGLHSGHGRRVWLTYRARTDRVEDRG